MQGRSLAFSCDVSKAYAEQGRFFLALCLAIPIATSAQLDVKAYKFSETADKITLKMEVRNNSKDDIVIRNVPTFVRDEHETYIYFTTTDEIKQLKSGKVISTSFPSVFCPERYEGKILMNYIPDWTQGIFL
jgi:hypothetical protein